MTETGTIETAPFFEDDAVTLFHGDAFEVHLWNQVAEPGEILCPQCFTERWALLHGAATWRLELIG